MTGVSSLVIDFFLIVVNTIHIYVFHQSLSCTSKNLNVCKYADKGDLLSALGHITFLYCHNQDIIGEKGACFLPKVSEFTAV